MAGGLTPRNARVGVEAPDFSLPYIGGTTNLRPFWLRGKPLVLLFSCGCVPCEEVARGLTEMTEWVGQAKVAIVVTNPYAATPEAAKQFRERSGYKGPMLADTGTVTTAYDAGHCPKLWLLDADGIARWSGTEGHSRPPEVLLSELKKALAALSTGTAVTTSAG